MSLPYYVVIVGNIGTVCEDSDRTVAMRFYRDYVAQSKEGGRAHREPVTFMYGDDVVKEYAPPVAALPTIKDLAALVRAVKADIADEYRAFEDDETPGIQLTVGWSDETGEWSYQTGDNSFSGGCYGYPHWGVVGVYRRSSSRDVARDIREQLQACLY